MIRICHIFCPSYRRFFSFPFAKLLDYSSTPSVHSNVTSLPLLHVSPPSQLLLSHKLISVSSPPHLKSLSQMCPVLFPDIAALLDFATLEKPNCRHTTPAFSELQAVSHTLLHLPLLLTSTKLIWPVVRRTSIPAKQNSTMPFCQSCCVPHPPPPPPSCD